MSELVYTLVKISAAFFPQPDLVTLARNQTLRGNPEHDRMSPRRNVAAFSILANA
jgi:hypothetical protein